MRQKPILSSPPAPSDRCNDVPLISVITVTFNLLDAGRRESFERAVDCVQAQSGAVLEHVIQDGASNDGTVEFIRTKTTDLDNVRFISEPDSGLYDAMNRASATARGTYLLFLNSDDSLASEDILRQASEALVKTGPDFAFGTTMMEDDDGNRSSQRTNLRSTLQRMPFCHNSLLIRRDVFAELGGHDTRLRVSADYDMVLRMIASGYTGLELGIPISLFWTRGVSADEKGIAHDFAITWTEFFGQYPAGAAYSVDDYVWFYERGHLPVRLMFQVLRSRKTPPALRSAALHSFIKSFRRALQPWRFRRHA